MKSGVERVSPVSYSPDAALAKKRALAFSCRVKLPILDEFYHLRQPHVSPERYTVKDELTKPTRYSKIMAGGSSPKSALIFNKNPGPGNYKERNTISEISLSKSKT